MNIMRARIDQCDNTVKAQLPVNRCKTGNAARLGDATCFNDNMVGQGLCCITSIKLRIKSSPMEQQTQPLASAI